MTYTNEKNIIEFIEGVQKDIISKLEKQGVRPHKTKVKNMVNDYISNIIINLSNDEILINGLCEEYKINKDLY